MGRFTTTGSFQNVRIPYSAFRRMDDGLGAAPQRLDPAAVRKLAICFENRSRQAKAARNTRDLESLSSRADREFKLELNRIHVRRRPALPACPHSGLQALRCRLPARRRCRMAPSRTSSCSAAPARAWTTRWSRRR